MHALCIVGIADKGFTISIVRLSLWTGEEHTPGLITVISASSSPFSMFVVLFGCERERKTRRVR